MKEQRFSQCCYIQIYLNYLIFYPTKLSSTDLSDYKNSKAYSYYKSGWLEPLYFHKLSGGKYWIFKGECRQSRRINNINKKCWIIIKKSGKIRSCHCTCMAGMGRLVTMLQLLCIELKQQSEIDWIIIPVSAQQINGFQTTGTFNPWKLKTWTLVVKTFVSEGRKNDHVSRH